MGWRTVVITKRSKLDYKMDYMVVRSTEVQKVHIKEISTLIISSTLVSMTAVLLAKLSENKVKVVFCDEKKNPYGELVSYYNKHNSSLTLKSQINWDPAFGEELWTEIVKNKISNQSKLLKRVEKPGFEMLMREMDGVELGDKTNREAQAARLYFKSLFGREFKRWSDDSVSICLNYGYTILLAQFNQSITSSGYLTQLGIKHDNQFNHFNLSSDFMEPFRPIVDEIVYTLNPEKFGGSEKKALLGMVNKEYLIEGKSRSFTSAVDVYVNSLLKALDLRDMSLIKKWENEL